MNDLQPTLGFIILICFLVARFSWHAHTDYEVDDLYPLHVHVRYPVKVVTACTACARMMNTWMTYRDIDTYIHKYSDFLVVMISVGSLRLALQRGRTRLTTMQLGHYLKFLYRL